MIYSVLLILNDNFCSSTTVIFQFFHLVFSVNIVMLLAKLMEEQMHVLSMINDTFIISLIRLPIYNKLMVVCLQQKDGEVLFCYKMGNNMDWHQYITVPIIPKISLALGPSLASVVSTRFLSTPILRSILRISLAPNFVMIFQHTMD